MKEKSQARVQLKQVTIEACNNARNCKMITMSSFKPINFLTRSNMGQLTLNVKLCFQNQNERNYKISTRKRSATY